MPSFNVLNGILFNKKINKKKLQKQQQQQQIKLQIEFPFNQFFNHDIDEDVELSSLDDYSVHNNNNKALNFTAVTSKSEKETKNVNRISLHISFDRNGRTSKPKINNFIENTTNKSRMSCVSSINSSDSGNEKKISINNRRLQLQNRSTTSGYSSSIGEILGDDDSCSEREILFNEEKTKSENNNKIETSSEEHVYDKLNYINNSAKLKVKRRHSLSSSNSGSSLATNATTSSNASSSFAASSSYFHLSKNNDYEEICNFSQVTSTPARFNNIHLLKNNDQNEDDNDDSTCFSKSSEIDTTYTYETLYNCKSSSIKRIRKINRKFIQEEEEGEEDDKESRNINNFSSNNNSTVINRFSKREYSVNEIFQNLEVFKKQANEEELHQKKIKTRTLVPPSQSTQLIKNNCKNKTHNYVNERIRNS